MKSAVVSRLVLFTLLGVLQALPVGAPVIHAQESNAAVFARVLNEGDQVRLASPGVSIADARVMRVTSDSLEVAQDGQQWHLSSNAVQRLELRRSSTRRWALRGAIGGAVVGMVTNFFVAELCTGCGLTRLGGGLVGAVAVGGLGAAIGSRNYQWEPIVP